MTAPQYMPLTQAQVGQLLLSIGAPDEPLASFRANPVEMTALIPSHTENKELRSLGARISRSQSDEIK